jgi:hypothetical protein
MIQNSNLESLSQFRDQPTEFHVTGIAANGVMSGVAWNISYMGSAVASNSVMGDRGLLVDWLSISSMVFSTLANP